MSHGLKKGDKVKVIDNRDQWHNFEVGEVVEYYGPDHGYYGFKRTSTNEEGLTQILKSHHFEKIEEDTTMAKKSNPKNFRNGDVIKVSNKDDYAALVYVKFGENYYNLTAGGQMKACRYLPPGTKEIITNLSGMGKFFLMSEEELEEQASRPSGGSVTDTNEDYYWATPITATTTLDYEKLQQFIDTYVHSVTYTDTDSSVTYVTDTTEEKS